MHSPWLQLAAFLLLMLFPASVFSVSCFDCTDCPEPIHTAQQREGCEACYKVVVWHRRRSGVVRKCGSVSCKSNPMRLSFGMKEAVVQYTGDNEASKYRGYCCNNGDFCNSARTISAAPVLFLLPQLVTLLTRVW